MMKLNCCLSVLTKIHLVSVAAAAAALKVDCLKLKLTLSAIVD